MVAHGRHELIGPLLRHWPSGNAQPMPSSWRIWRRGKRKELLRPRGAASIIVIGAFGLTSAHDASAFEVSGGLGDHRALV